MTTADYSASIAGMQRVIAADAPKPRSPLLASERLTSSKGRAVLSAIQKPGDPLVSIYARLWFAGDGIDDAPEVRCRCKPDMYPQLWQIAIAQCQAILEML